MQEGRGGIKFRWDVSQTGVENILFVILGGRARGKKYYFSNWKLDFSS